MPKLAQYEAPEGLGLRPTEVGITATAAAARRVGSEYSEAAAAQTTAGRNIAEAVQGIGTMAVKFAEHQELSTGTAESAKILDNLTKSKDARIASLDPNDPAYAQKVEGVTQEWREKTLEPTLESFSKGFMTTKGQAWAQNFAASTRESMFKHTTADVMTAASIGIKNNIKTFASVSSNAALRDPSLVDTLLTTADTNVAALVSSSPIKGTQAAKFQGEILEETKRKIVEAGAIGAIQKAADPEAAAQEWIAKFPEYIDGHKAIVLAQNARQQIRAREADTRTNETRLKDARKEASSEARDQHTVKIYSQDPKLIGDPTAQSILNDPSLTPEHRSQLLGLYSRQLKPETDTRISARNTNTFMSELQPGVKPLDDETFRADFEKRIWEARTKDPGDPESITKGDHDYLRKELAEARTPEGRLITSAKADMMKAVKQSIDKSNPMMGDIDHDGGINLYRFEQDLTRKINQYRSTPGKNWQDLFDPNKPDFAGAPKALEPFQKSLTQSQADTARRFNAGPAKPSATPAPAPPVAGAIAAPAPPVVPLRKPGETVTDYRRRIGG